VHKYKIVVIGAGPAGIMSAIRASELGQDVTIIEKNSILGKKLLLSGKGRCNLTNACDLKSFLSRFSKNGEFLRDAFKKFFNQDLVSFFQTRGLNLKTERQLRVFPVTDSSSSITTVLMKELEKNKVQVVYETEVCDLVIRDKVIKGVKIVDGGIIAADKVILATGGASYSFTGSTGDGIALARKFGHEIVPLRPGLVPLKIRESFPKILEGLVLKNIKLKFICESKDIETDVGELLFTSSGISGPLVLTYSGRIVDWLNQKKNVFVEIDLKPGLTSLQLEQRLLRDFKVNAKKIVKNSFKDILPIKLIDLFLKLLSIDPHKKVNQITQKERNALLGLLKGWRLEISSSISLEQGMVTRGGVSLKNINPRTMESRLIKGLYFCGEMIDVDADTGGFNLQAAFSTGYLAGESAAA